MTRRTPPDSLAVAFGAHVLAGAGRVVTPDRETAEPLRAAGVDAAVESLEGVAPGTVEAAALVADELSCAGDHAEAHIAAAAAALRPGGRLAVAAVGSLHAGATGQGRGLRTFTAAELARLLGLAGFEVTGQWAPGAARRLAGAPPAFDPQADRAPGLLDAGERVAALARRYRHPGERERAFFASLPRKVVAAAVVCRDRDGRLLVVHDAFKRHWTIPGGVVDADEDPRAGAAREAREEAGVEVGTDRLLGVFAMSWPDRLLLVYSAHPLGDPTPRPLHPHEIDAAAWVELPEAFRRLDPRIASQVRRCLHAPGGTWHDAP